MKKDQDSLDSLDVESLIPEVKVASPDGAEQEIVKRIRELWPSARKSGKEIGEHLFNLRKLCRDKEAHFNKLLESLGIPRSTAYNYISIFEECQIVDFEFPTNILRFAAAAGIDHADPGQRKILFTAFKESEAPIEPDDPTAIGVVGSAVTAIREAAAEANEAEQQLRELTPLEQMFAAVTTALVTAYKSLVGGKKETKKMSETAKAAKEATFVDTIADMFHVDSAEREVRERILGIGRGEQKMQDLIDEWKKLPSRYRVTRETAPIYDQKKGGDA